MTYGVDVAATRTDELDKQQFKYVSELDAPLALDLGCGQGGQSVRLAAAGARVIGVDVGDFESVFAEHRASRELSLEQLQFVQAGIAQFVNTYYGERFAIVTCQRTLHYLPYDEALLVLKNLRTVTDGRLYLSVTGSESAIGAAHAKRQLPLPERFARLQADAQETFSITVPLLVYTMEEIKELVQSAGWQEVWSRTTDFGNHLVVTEAK